MDMVDELEKSEKLSKRSMILIAVVLIVIVAVIMGVMIFGGTERVRYTALEDSEIPMQIKKQVLPEYQALERALACVVGDKVYVLACRGEKPTSGYEIAIDRMTVEKTDGISTLKVYATFKNPEPGTEQAQVLIYPLQIAETDLTYLPDQIELKVDYPKGVETQSSSGLPVVELDSADTDPLRSVDTERYQSADAEAYFEEVRATIDKDRSAVIAMLTDVIDSTKESSAEYRNATIQKQEIIDYMNQEKELEIQIKEIGFSDVLVLLTDSNVSVTVDKQEITQQEVTQICDAIFKKARRGADQVTIQSKH